MGMLRATDEGQSQVIVGLVLAAGAGTRFGGAKQLADLHGTPLLEHALRAMAAAQLGRVVVVLGASAEEILGQVDLHGAAPVICDRWEDGQSASLAYGLSTVDDAEAALVVLGDQPRLSPQAIERVLQARDPGVEAVRASYYGEPGHPVLLERSLFARLRDVSGDRGARNLLRSVKTREVSCDDLGGGEDVDTLAQLEALRQAGPLG
jgi:molybdenum cofactor cytidylyltransferase